MPKKIFIDTDIGPDCDDAGAPVIVNHLYNEKRQNFSAYKPLLSLLQFLSQPLKTNSVKLIVDKIPLEWEREQESLSNKILKKKIMIRKPAMGYI